MSKTDSSALIALIAKVVDMRLKKILPGLIEKYINESMNIELDGSMMAESIARTAKKQIIGNKQKSKNSTKNGNLMKMILMLPKIVILEK